MQQTAASADKWLPGIGIKSPGACIFLVSLFGRWLRADEVYSGSAGRRQAGADGVTVQWVDQQVQTEWDEDEYLVGARVWKQAFFGEGSVTSNYKMAIDDSSTSRTSSQPEIHPE